MNTDASLVVVIGGNASGKTTFLESIYTVFSGRSFRTRHNSQLINANSQGYLIRGVVEELDGVASTRHLATQLERKQAPRFRIDGEDVRPSQLARLFPLQLVDASIFDLVDGSPAHRRRFFDWGMFHVKHQFFPLWKKHRKIAAHWNALLRAGRPVELPSWRQAFVEVSEELAAIRESYLFELAAMMASEEEKDSNQQFFGGSVDISFNRGWPKELGYGEFLEDSMERDLRERRLRAGAHFFDIGMTLDGRPVKEVFSRGQKKLFGLKLKLAQIKLYNALPNRPNSAVLVDDLAAEVDHENQKRAIREILDAGSQVFLTAVDREQLESTIPENVDKKMFHVEQGVITEID